MWERERKSIAERIMSTLKRNTEMEDLRYGLLNADHEIFVFSLLNLLGAINTVCGCFV